MKRTTIMLPRGLKAKAEREARRIGESLGELIRQSLERRLEEAAGENGRDPFFADHFTFKDNGPPDVAANADKYVSEMILEDYERTQRDAREQRASRERRQLARKRRRHAGAAK
jgi:hypothetical protein